MRAFKLRARYLGKWLCNSELYDIWLQKYEFRNSDGPGLPAAGCSAIVEKLTSVGAPVAGRRLPGGIAGRP